MQNEPNTLKSMLGFGIGLLIVLFIIYCLRRGWTKFRRPRTKGLCFHLWRSGAVSNRWRQAAFKSFISRALAKDSFQVNCAKARQYFCASLEPVDEPARSQLTQWAAALNYEEGLCRAAARQLQKSNVVAKNQLVQVAEHDKYYLEVILCAAAVAGPATVALAAAHKAAGRIREGGATAVAGTSDTAAAVAAAALLAVSAVETLLPKTNIQLQQNGNRAAQAATAAAAAAKASAATAAAAAIAARTPGGAQQPAASAALAAAVAAVNAVTVALSAARTAAAGAEAAAVPAAGAAAAAAYAAAPEASIVAASAEASAKAASLAAARATELTGETAARSAVEAASAAAAAAQAVKDAAQGAASVGVAAAAAATGVSHSVQKAAQGAVSATQLMVDILGDAVQAVAEAKASADTSEQVFAAQQAAGKQWARLLFVEAVKPLRRLHDPQVLMRGLSTLITLNVFLASAVFIGLSLTSPDDVNGSIRYAQGNITAAINWAAQSNSGAPFRTVGTATEGPQAVPVSYAWTQMNSTSTLGNQTDEADKNSRNSSYNTVAGEAAQRLKPLYELPGAQAEPCWYEKGRTEAKPTLMVQQVIAFALFVGSAGIAYAILLSLSPDSELDHRFEQAVAWGSYIFLSGIPTCAGICFLLMSLVAMVEVQYGPYKTWHNTPTCPPYFLSFYGFFLHWEVFCLVLGTVIFFYCWTIF